ncbi:MAG: sensor histidine kinase [Deltaproteobacteria bacterium]|nr:sensor histidine kinase [Deltaproteobacteria bacterium]
MRLRPRLTLLIGLATLIPLAVAGVMATTVARDAHLAQARELYARQADGLAVFAATWLSAQVRGVQLIASSWDVRALDAARAEGLARLIYSQYDAINVVVLLDAEGEPLVAPTAIRDPALLTGALAEHEAVDEARLGELVARMPYTQALTDGLAFGEAYFPAGSPHAVMPVAVVSSGGDAVIGVELSLAAVEEQLRRQASRGGAALILDERAKLLAGDDAGLIEPSVLASFTNQVEGWMTLTSGDGEDALVAFAPVSDLGWVAVVAVPLREATLGGRQIAQRTVFIYVLATALVATMGYIGARQIAQPVVALKDTAVRLGEGELGRQVQIEAQDELGELAGAFNQMSARLLSDQGIIAAKNAEIEAWNRELLARVEARTTELQESQQRLVHTSRMVAVAELGAGLAHELNNPMAGILGMAQLARAKGGGDVTPMILAIEEQAQRCRVILASLTRLSSRGAVEERAPLDLQQLLAEVLVLVGGSFRDGDQHLSHEREPPLRVLGDSAQLAQAFAQLLRSLRTALVPGGRLFIHGVAGSEEVRVSFRLSGWRGAGGDDWLASGMGFWVARQVFAEHGGRLIEPQPGAETPVYIVTLPSEAARRTDSPRAG